MAAGALAGGIGGEDERAVGEVLGIVSFELGR